MNNYFNRLKEIAPTLLSETLDYADLTKSLSDYRALLLEITSLDLENQENLDNIALKDGVAIGPTWAARCLDDVLRTKKFIRGVFLAVSSLAPKKKPIEILYSGTGPFATLILPLLVKFTSDEIQFTLVEVNPISYQHVKNVFKHLNAENYINTTILEDATQLQLPNPEDIDIIIVECLQHALAREPQVAITVNYIQQCREDVILIPEDITLNLTLMDRAKEVNSFYIDDNRPERIDKKAFVLNKETASVFNLDNKMPIHLNEKQTVFSDKELLNKTVLAISTTIKVYDEEYLHNYDSGLTIPFIHSEISEKDNPLIVESFYEIGEEPKLHIKKNHYINT